MSDERYNRRNPAVKRILQEVKEMQSNPSDDFVSFPLEENIFEWQFAVRGPRETEFEGGIYHGRIQLPAEYPFKPPSFMLLTPSWRFETQTKICLSISNHHPEHWQPSWSVRTALVALIAFMPTNPEGALGSLDYKKEERRILAIKSREAPPKYGNRERQKLMDEIHQYMLGKVPPVPEVLPGPTTDEDANNMTNEEAHVNPSPDTIQAAEEQPDAGVELEGREDIHAVRVDAAAGPLRVSLIAGVSLSRTPEVEAGEQRQSIATRVQKPKEDRLFTWAAFGLTVAILVLLLKKFMKSGGFAGFTGGI